MNIKYTTYENINKKKWDKCISTSTNHLVYAESWYLDIICGKNWNALILNDYDAVMPLPLKSKMGLIYVQQPIWAQQLGVFSKHNITSDITNCFLNIIPTKLAMISLNLNETNFIKHQKLEPKTNLVINLNHSFERLQSSYSSNTKRNCKKSGTENLSIHFDSKNVTEFISFFKQHAKSPSSAFRYASLTEIVLESTEQQKGFIVLIKDQNEIIAASFILKSHNRLIYRTGVSNEKGRKLKAMFLLVNELIKKYANSNYVLDFEGSEIERVARFYKGFGAQIQPYYYYKKYNNKLLKMISK